MRPSFLLLLVPLAVSLPIDKRSMATQPTGVEWAGFFSGLIAIPSAFAIPALLFSYLTSRGYNEGVLQQKYYEQQRQIARQHEQKLRDGSAEGGSSTENGSNITPPPPSNGNPPKVFSPHPPPVTPPIITPAGGYQSLPPPPPPLSPGPGSGSFHGP